MKCVTSLGHPDIWGMIALMVEHKPHLWRKVARFTNKLRSENNNLSPKMIPNLTGQTTPKAIEYARQAFKDTVLPYPVQASMRIAVAAEFNFDIERA